MRYIAIAIFFLLLIAPVAKSEELQQNRLIKDLDQIAKQSTIRQEYVQVSREKYPGLVFEVTTPVESANRIRPKKVRQPLSLYPSWRVAGDAAYERSGQARPYKSGKVAEVSLPVDQEGDR